MDKSEGASAQSRSAIRDALREWMDAYFHLRFDDDGQVKSDSLVAAAAQEFNHPEWLEDQFNVAWEVAVAVADDWEQFYATL